MVLYICGSSLSVYCVCVLYVTMPCRAELCNCNLFCPFFATIQRKLLDQSIWRKQLLYLTFQYMPMYVLRVCLYVFLITVDRLVLCTPSVLCFLLECFHLGVYALTGIFLFVTERNTEYWFYNIFCFYMLLHMPSLLWGCWRFPWTLCFIYGLMGFYIFSGVSSFILYDVAKSIFRIWTFLKCIGRKLVQFNWKYC